MKYPCKNCNRVACPHCCDNKSCQRWRRWFLERWAYTRLLWGEDDDRV